MNPTVIQVTNADLAALIQAANATLAKIDALAEKLNASADEFTDDFGALQRSIATALLSSTASVKEIADAVKTFKINGPMGIHGGSNY